MRAKRWHVLKDNAGVETPALHIFLDTETNPVSEGMGITELNLKLGWALFWDRGTLTRKEKLEWFFFTKASEFWSWVELHLYEKSKVVMWAHNMDFDLRVVEGFKYLQEMGFETGFPIMDSTRVIMKIRHNKRTLHILDTANYFKGSLKQLGDDIGIPKHEINFDTCTMDELKAYCKQDVNVIYQAVKKLLLFIEDEDIGNFQPTIAGLAFTAFKHRFMTYPLFIHADKKATQLERKAYKGGRVEAFRIGDVSDLELTSLDVNSMYPSVMYEYNLPSKLLYTKENPDVNTLLWTMKKYCVIADVECAISEPCIAVKRERLIFPIGNFRETITAPELELVVKHGKILKCHMLAAYQAQPILRDYVAYFYAQKSAYKEQGNKTYTMFSKYMLNTLYGKFGQKSVEMRPDRAMKPGAIEGTYRFYDMMEKKMITEYHINGIIYRSSGYVDGADTLVAIPALITALARCKLWNLIEKAGKDNCVYCDTDSLFVTPEGLANLEDEIDPLKLGMLSIDDKRLLEVRGAKWYRTDKGWKIKGIRGDARKIDDVTYSQIQFERFRSGLRKGRVNQVTTKDIVKHLSSDYKKGVVQVNGKVRPFSLNELSPKDETVKKEEIMDNFKKAVGW